MQSRRDLQAVLWFLVLTFGLTWTLWGAVWALGCDRRSPLWPFLIGLGMWGPGLSVLLVTKLVLRESWRTTTIDRLGPKRCYLWAWFLPAAGTLASTGLTAALTAANFDPHFSRFRETLEAQGLVLPIPLWAVVASQIVAALTIAPLINAPFALGEELGWRGFLLPRLMKAGLGPWPALVLSGVIWGVWHAPVIAQGHNYPDHPYLGVLLMIVFCTLLGIIFGWLQLSSGSVWVPTIAHGALNAIAGLPLLVLTEFDTAVGGMLTSLIGWIPLTGFVVWLAWTNRLPVVLAADQPPAEGRGPAVDTPE